MNASRKLKRRDRDLNPFTKLVREARSYNDSRDQCLSSLPPPRIAFKIVEGWSAALSATKHNGIECLHLSMKLHPPGRSSTSEDWKRLGALIARLLNATGWEGGLIEPITPIESTHPNRTLHWAWHSDGSSLDEEMLKIMRKYFMLREEHQPKDGTWTPRQ